MLMLSQALSARECSLRAPLTFTAPNGPLFSRRKSKLAPNFNSRKLPTITLANAERGVDSASATSQSISTSSITPFENDQTVFVGDDNVPLEGVIQFEKPSSSTRLQKWGRVALLAGGDVVALLMFAAIGRFNHGFSVFDAETLRTADPFIAGWFLSAYFLGGYGENGRGMNGFSKAVTASAKSWALGIPLGLIIRAATSSHLPPYNFILVTMGSTGVLLIGWRALFCSLLPADKNKKNDMYRHGSPFELFELLMSLVRRW